MIRKYFKDASILAVSDGILQLKGLILIPFITREFGPINYGVWSQVAVLLATIAPIVVMGTDSAHIRLMPGLDTEKQKRGFSGWMLFLLGMALLFSLPLYFFRESLVLVFFGDIGGEYVPFIALAATWLIVSTMLHGIQTWFRIQSDVKLFSAINLAQAAFNIIAVAIVLIQDLGVYQLILFTLISDTCLIATMLVVIRLKSGLAWPDFSFLPAMLRFGIPLVPAGFAVWGLNYFDRLFLAQYSTLEKIGIYAVTYTISTRVIPLLVKPWRAMFPNSAAELFNTGKKAELQRLFERSAGLALALSVPAAVGLGLLGDRLLTLLTTGAFVSGAPLLVFISTGYIFFVMSSYYSVALGLVHKQYLYTWATILGLASNIILNLILIPRLDILGAAIATNLSFLILLGLSMFFSNRFEIIKTDFSYIAKVVGSSMLMAVGIFVLDSAWIKTINNTVVEVLLLAAIGAVLYAGCLFVLGVLHRSELKLAFSMLNRNG